MTKKIILALALAGLSQLNGSAVRAEAVYDSVVHRTRMIFVSAIPNVYLIHARYPLHSDDTTGYAQIATSFMNSLRLPEADFSGRSVKIP